MSGATAVAQPDLISLLALRQRAIRYWLAAIGLAAFGMAYAGPIALAIRAPSITPTVVLPALDLPTVTFPSFSVPALHAAPVVPNVAEQPRTHAPAHAVRHQIVTAHGRPSAPDTPARKTRVVHLPVVKDAHSQLSAKESNTNTKTKADPFAKAAVVEDSVNAEPGMPEAATAPPLQPQELTNLPDYAQQADSPEAVAAAAVPVTNAAADPLAELRAKLAEQGITLAEEGSIPLNSGSTGTTTTPNSPDTTTTTPPASSGDTTTTNTGSGSGGSGSTNTGSGSGTTTPPANTGSGSTTTPPVVTPPADTTTPPSTTPPPDTTPTPPAPAVPWITATVTQIDFGTVTEGTHATRPVQVTNILTDPITIPQPTIIGDADGAFSVASAGPTTLAPGAGE